MSLPMYRASKGRVLLVAGALVIAIALVDWLIAADVPLGFLYLVPMLMLGRVLRPWQTVIVAGVMTLLTEEFDTFRWTIRTGMPRDVLYFAAFLAIGIFVYQTDLNRRMMLEHMDEIERQSAARQDAEEELKVLIESSPAAIATTDQSGRVLLANEAAHRLLGVQPGSLPGRFLHRYFPALTNVTRADASRGLFRAVMQARGIREDGDTLMAEICCSTYATRQGARVAAMILDASEELRTREESSLHQMLAGSRIAVGAVSHEIRNVCGAISVIHQNLSRNSLMSRNKDFEALGNLVLALERISAVDLRQYPESCEEVDLLSVLDELKIVIAPAIEEEAIACTWNLPSDLPAVWADRANLMQIFLNLTKNSIRALSQTDEGRELTIAADTRPGAITLSFEDSGGGVAHPEELFHPFQPTAQATGLGLYLSRAFARAMGGDVRYKPSPGRACFLVDLPVAGAAEET